MAEADSLRILMLCVRVPYPARDGGSIAMLNMIRAFHNAGHELTVLCMNTPKHYSQLHEIPRDILGMADFLAVDVDTEPRPLDALANLLFSRKSYHIERFTSRIFRNELETQLTASDRPYDVVQLETLFMAPYIPTIRRFAPQAKVVMRAHNIEHDIWARRAGNEKAPLRQYYYQVTAARLQRYELAFYSSKRADAIVPITEPDAKRIKAMGNDQPTFVCPTGIDFSTIPPVPEKEAHDPPGLFFIGALDWQPNLEGLRWFLAQVWPILRRRHPDLTLYLAGRNMPSEILNLDLGGVEALGEVESAAQFFIDHEIMIVPLLSGSGMRIKIVEGMAYAKPIVATHLAAEGLAVKHGEHIMLADDPEAFAEAILVLIDHPGMRRVMGQKAAELCQTNYDNDQISSGLTDFYRGLSIEDNDT